MAGPQQQFGNTMHQQASSTFSNIANIGPPQPQQQQAQPQGDKFAPGNIFAAMKRQDFAKPEEQRPQDSGKSSYSYLTVWGPKWANWNRQI